MYTAVVLTPNSIEQLLARFGRIIPTGWETKAHHMTINMGPATAGPALEFMGQEVELTIVSFSVDKKFLVMALGVECEVPSVNTQKHITLAVNTAKGGKPVMSNSLTKWVKAKNPMVVRGVVQEVT